MVILIIVRNVPSLYYGDERGLVFLHPLYGLGHKCHPPVLLIGLGVVVRDSVLFQHEYDGVEVGVGNG